MPKDQEAVARERAGAMVVVELAIPGSLVTMGLTFARQARISFTTLPCTSVSRKSRPA
jgi:hypothetical protein